MSKYQQYLDTALVPKVITESADAKFKSAVSDINTMLTDASRKAAALGKEAKALEDAIDKARDIAFKLR